MKLSRAYDILWPEWGTEKAKEFLELAMAKFKTSSVSVSIFDEGNEIFKGETGYHKSHVDRAISFAAHCLLSKDLFVILDTEQVFASTSLCRDWLLMLLGLAIYQ